MALAAKDAALGAKDASISIREATYQEMLVELKRLREELRRERERREELEVDEGLAYEQLKRRVYDLLDDTIPQGATVLVVSGGDDGFVHLNGREVWHFPRTEDGLWNGQPGTSQDAIDQLEAIRATTTAYLVFPLPEFWWLDFYRELAAYLHERCEVLVNRVNAAVVFTLSAREGAPASGERAAT
jgi:hypothetical protein